MPFSVDVYSTRALDTVIDKTRGKTTKHVGGPACFISAAFEKQEIATHVHVGPVVDVSIVVDELGETGNVGTFVENTDVPACQSGRTIISTLLREWNPQAIAKMCSEIYLDVQGFVREPNTPGHKRMWDAFQGDWIKKVCCLKATETELPYLPTKSVEDQKTRMLLVTKGSDGADVFVGGRHFALRPPRVVASVDTIGAGDTFFANVVARMILGDTPETAVIVALEETSRFLERKVST